MACIDLTELCIDELKQLKKYVAKAIEGFEARRIAEARAAAESAAKVHGFSLPDIVGGAKGGKSVSVPKCRHPDNPVLDEIALYSLNDILGRILFRLAIS